jgi:hypothetical protein
MVMEHFSESQWVDYVRGLTADRDPEAMKAHLESGCRRCNETARAMTALVRLAADDLEATPPDRVVRAARAIHALREPDPIGLLPRLKTLLVYDSFLEPIAMGIRSGQPVSRQLLYEAGPYLVDLQLSHEPGARQVWLTGQIAATAEPRSVRNLRIVLTADSRIAASDTTSDTGEFQLAYEQPGRVQLRIEINPEGEIQLPLSTE